MKQLIIKSYDTTEHKFEIADEQADEVVRLLERMKEDKENE